MGELLLGDCSLDQVPEPDEGGVTGSFAPAGAASWKIGPESPLGEATAGFNIAPDMDMERVMNFRRNVDCVRAWMRDAEGLMAAHNFVPHTRGDDGVTMSLWRELPPPLA
jgi:hypothetical protein